MDIITCSKKDKEILEDTMQDILTAIDLVNILQENILNSKIHIPPKDRPKWQERMAQDLGRSSSLIAVILKVLEENFDNFDGVVGKLDTPDLPEKLRQARTVSDSLGQAETALSKLGFECSKE